MEQKILPAQGEASYAQSLEIAIEREIKAKFMYKTMARFTKVEHMKTKLEFLAAEEQSHRDNLEDLYKKIVGKTKDFDGMVSFPDEKKAAKVANLEIPELLKIAIGKEIEANEFYKKMASTTEDDAAKNIFNYLAEEEMTHQRMLEIELKLYMGEKPLARPVEAIPGIYRDWW